MNEQTSICNPIQRSASFALVVCLMYQLGACPCGCLEHNAWAQMIGLHADDHQHSRVVADEELGFLNIVNDHGDCTGEPRAQYVNNARPVSPSGAGVSFHGDIHEPVAEEVTLRIVAFDTRPARSFCSEHPHALSLPTLQVFRL